MDEYKKLFADERYNSLAQRLEVIESRQKDIEELVSSVAVLAHRMGSVENSVSEIRGNVRTLMDKPAKRWDSVIEKTLLVVVGAVIAWILAQIGL